MITIVKPIPYLHTTAKNKTTHPKSLELIQKKQKKEEGRCLPCPTNIMPCKFL